VSYGWTVMGISAQPLPVKLNIEQKQLENVKYFKYLGSMGWKIYLLY
jgi:hypothetical protein